MFKMFKNQAKKLMTISRKQLSIHAIFLQPLSISLFSFLYNYLSDSKKLMNHHCLKKRGFTVT